MLGLVQLRQEKAMAISYCLHLLHGASGEVVHLPGKKNGQH